MDRKHGRGMKENMRLLHLKQGMLRIGGSHWETSSRMGENMGTPKSKISNVSYEVFAFFQKPKYDNKGGVWSKVVLVNETLETGKFEWVLWMDFDSLFMNMSTKMEHFMENAKKHLKEGQKWEDVSMIAAPDWYETTTCKLI